MRNVHTWSTTSTPPPKTPASAARNPRGRPVRSTHAYVPTTSYTPPVYAPLPLAPAPAVQPNPPRPPLPSTPQAIQSTYASRLRTGATLLMQPILASTATTNSRTTTRRGGVINYADPGSGDEFPDAGAIDSDDSDFVASGGTRTAIRQTRGGRMNTGLSIFNSAPGPSGTPNRIGTPQMDRNELDQSYLGQIPPERFIKPRLMQPTAHEYPYICFHLLLIHLSHLYPQSTRYLIAARCKTNVTNPHTCRVWDRYSQNSWLFRLERQWGTNKARDIRENLLLRSWSPYILCRHCRSPDTCSDWGSWRGSHPRARSRWRSRPSWFGTELWWATRMSCHFERKYRQPWTSYLCVGSPNSFRSMSR